MTRKSLDWHSDKKWPTIFIVTWIQQQTNHVSTVTKTFPSAKYFSPNKTCLQIILHVSQRGANLWPTYQIICQVLHNWHCCDVTVSFHVNSCSFVETYRHFRGIYCLQLKADAAFYRNASTHQKIPVSQFVIRCAQSYDYFHFRGVGGHGGENVLDIIIDLTQLASS